jgi:hypothetical protein
VSTPTDRPQLRDTVNALANEQTRSGRRTSPQTTRTTERAHCPGTTKHGTPCRSTVIADDGYCPAHSPGKPHNLSAAGRKGGKASGASRRAQRDGGTKLADASVRRRLQQETVKCSDKVVNALMRGVESEDPNVAVRAAVQLLEQGFGRVGQALPEEGEPSAMVTALFRRPPRRRSRIACFAVLRDGRILEVATLADEPEPDDAA